MTDIQNSSVSETNSAAIAAGSTKTQTPGRGLTIAGAIVAGSGLLFAISPIFLFLLGNPVAPWLMIITLPFGGLVSVIGLVLLIVGVVRMSQAGPVSSAGTIAAGDSNTATSADIRRARLFVFVAAPALLITWPIVWFVVNNMIFGQGAVASISNALWPLAQIGLSVFGIVLTARAKPSSSVSVPIYIVAGLLLLLTVCGSLLFLGGSI